MLQMVRILITKFEHLCSMNCVNVSGVHRSILQELRCLLIFSSPAASGNCSQQRRLPRNFHKYLESFFVYADTYNTEGNIEAVLLRHLPLRYNHQHTLIAILTIFENFR